MESEFCVKGFSDIGTGARDYGRGVVRLSPEIAERVGVQRNTLVRLFLPSTGLVRYAIYRPHVVERAVLALEYDDRLSMGIQDKNAHYTIVIEKGGLLGYAHFLMSHPDVLVRLSFIYSLLFCFISALLGFILGMSVK